jgi:hypothetical protein
MLKIFFTFSVLLFMMLSAQNSVAQENCESNFITNATCANRVNSTPGSYCKPYPDAAGYSYFCRSPVSSSSSSAASSSPPAGCSPHLSEDENGNCVCAEQNMANDGNQCVSACPQGHKENGMCYAEDCPYGEGEPAACNENECAEEGKEAVEMLPGSWYCMATVPDEGGSSSSGGDSSSGSGDDGSGGSGSSSGGDMGGSSSSGQDIPECLFGATWGQVNGIWACWSGIGDCPSGQTWGTVNGVTGCHGDPIESCPTGQTYGVVNGVAKCYGAPACPAGYTFGSINFVEACYDNSGCDAMGQCAGTSSAGNNSSASGGNSSASNSSGSGGSAGSNSSGQGAGQCDPTAKNYSVCIGETQTIPDDLDDSIKNAFYDAAMGKVDEVSDAYTGDIESFSGIPTDYQDSPNPLMQAVRAYLPPQTSCTPIELEFFGSTQSVPCDFFNHFRLIFGWFLTVYAAIYIWSFSTAPINR